MVRHSPEAPKNRCKRRSSPVSRQLRTMEAKKLHPYSLRGQVEFQKSQALCVLNTQTPGRNYIRARPAPPHFGQKTFFRERGGGVYLGGEVYILKPPTAGFYTPPPPLLHRPPTPRRVFPGVGGWGCIKFGPVQTPPLFVHNNRSQPLLTSGRALHTKDGVNIL